MTDRSYPALLTKPIMYQSWHDLLFMHWSIPIESLQPLIPTGLDIDTFNHQAWIAVVPFRMSHIHPRGLFPVPWLSAFAELNVRTYVIRDGKPGVWFFSLEAANPVAVWLARTWFKLPYYNAAMSCKESDSTIHYSSHRTHRKAPSCDFKGSYAPIENIQFAQKGSLEHFFTARYCLYTSDKNGRLYRGEIDHEPWPLQRAKATIQTNTMTSPLNIALSGPPLLHFSKSIQVRVWELEAL